MSIQLTFALSTYGSASCLAIHSCDDLLLPFRLLGTFVASPRTIFSKFISLISKKKNCFEVNKADRPKKSGRTRISGEKREENVLDPRKIFDDGAFGAGIKEKCFHHERGAGIESGYQEAEDG